MSNDFDDNKDQVIAMISTYSSNNRGISKAKQNSHKDLILFDLSFILPLIKSKFNKNVYSEIKTAQLYFTLLESIGIAFENDLKDMFSNKKFRLSLVLNQNLIYGQDKHYVCNEPRFKKENGKIDWEKVKEFKSQELDELTLNFGLDQYKEIIELIYELVNFDEKEERWSLETSYREILYNLLNKDINIFFGLISYILDQDRLAGELQYGNLHTLIKGTLEKLDINHRKFYDIIENSNSKFTNIWEVLFFRYLKKDYINEFYTSKLFGSIKAIKDYFIFPSFEFLLNYEYRPGIIEVITGFFSKKTKNQYENSLVKVASILLKKEKGDTAKIQFERDFNIKYKQYFSSNRDLLIQIYKSRLDKDIRFDSESKELAILTSMAPAFLSEFLSEFINSNFDFGNPRLPISSFRFIWGLENYIETLDDLMELAISRPNILLDHENFANDFFKNLNNEERERGMDYIELFIINNIDRKQAICLIFNVITYSFFSKRLDYLKLFLGLNKSLEVFKEIRMYQWSGIYSGSRIPILKERIDFQREIDNLIQSLPNSISYTGHRAYLKEQISFLNEEIKVEKKREWDDFFN